VPFRDTEWAEISDLIDLPSDARFQIGGALAFYKSERAASTAASRTTKRSVGKIRQYATKLHDELYRILDDPIFFVAGQPYWSSRPRLKKADFEELLSNVDQLQSIMETAQSRMQMPPGRKSTQAIDRLVQTLSAIQAEVSQDNTQRSSKKPDKTQRRRSANSTAFVVLCAEKVGLTEPQIQRSLKRTIARFHDSLTNHGFDTSVGKSIHGKHEPKSRRSRTPSDGHWRIPKIDVIAHLRNKKKRTKRN
jgi:hypothetical protein